MVASPSPADEFERDRNERRAILEHRLFWLLRIWFLGQLATLVLLVVAPAVRFGDGRAGIIAFMALLWLLALGPAFVAAWTAFWNWSVISRRWRFFGLAPWGVLAIEATFGALILA